MTRITLIKPDDWHAHVRDSDAMRSVIGFTAKQFARAIIMPNLKPPITTVEAAKNYRDRIIKALGPTSEFQPLMTLYLTDSTSVQEIKKINQSTIVHAVKYYPAGATTNSENGVTDINKCAAVLDAMQAEDIPLLVHGEVTDAEIDVFDREQVFIDRVLIPVHKQFPQLRIVFEHITTKQAVEFVHNSGDNIAATITPQHLLYDRNELFRGGIRPHFYCLPILKRSEHKHALVEAATSGNKKFFLGTDTAPHTINNKENHCGCAGIFSAHAALELYVTVFENAGKLQQLENFASRFGAEFYRLPVNTAFVTLEKRQWRVPKSYPYANSKIIPLCADENIEWKLLDDTAL